MAVTFQLKCICQTLNPSVLRLCELCAAASAAPHVRWNSGFRLCCSGASEPVRQVQPKPHHYFHLGIFEAMEYGLFGPNFPKTFPRGGPLDHPPIHGRTNVEYLPTPLLLHWTHPEGGLRSSCSCSFFQSGYSRSFCLYDCFSKLLSVVNLVG